VDSATVLQTTAALADVRIAFWLDGGWGVDALLGAQHRPHSDLDLVVTLDSVPRVITALSRFGYTDLGDFLPTRAVLRALDGRKIDLHPVTFDEYGRGWQANARPDGGDCEYPADGFTTGSINGVEVQCLAPHVQLAHHLGYDPRTHDFDDVRRIVRRFGLAVPEPYRCS
jgi:lincosamide nucleotidyltransferase A/C/D/E